MTTSLESMPTYQQELEFTDSSVVKAELEQRFGMQPAEIDMIEQQAEAMLPHTRVVVRTPLSALEGIVSQGRLQAASETKTSNGLTAGSGKDLDRLDEYLSLRQQFETDKLDWNEAEAPIIYGFLGYSDDPNDHNIQAPVYGRVELKLQADISNRSSYTIGDSLDKAFDSGPAQILDHADATLVQQAMEYGRQQDKHALNQVPYVEAQVRGGVSIQDIESAVITIEPSDLDEPMLDLLQELATLAPDCKVVVNLDYSSPQKLPIELINALPNVEFRPVIVSRSEPIFIQRNSQSYQKGSNSYEEYQYNQDRERHQALGRKFLEFFKEHQQPDNLGEPALGHYRSGDRFPPNN